jgi:hypothetical protein
MWRWRDWVIAAFNRNQPFDRFTLEQLAGDMLPNATLSQKIATGFNRNIARTRGWHHPRGVRRGVRGGPRRDDLRDVPRPYPGVRALHNHKYDPFTQKEFYQVFAYLITCRRWDAP